MAGFRGFNHLCQNFCTTISQRVQSVSKGPCVRRSAKAGLPNYGDVDPNVYCQYGDRLSNLNGEKVNQIKKSNQEIY